MFTAAPAAVRERFGSVESFISESFVDRAIPTAAHRIVSQTQTVDGLVTVTEQHEGVDGRVRENEVQVQRDGQGNWRQIIPDGLLRKLGNALNDVAASPKP